MDLFKMLYAMMANDLVEQYWGYYQEMVAAGEMEATTDPKEMFTHGVLATITGLQAALEEEIKTSRKAQLN